MKLLSLSQLSSVRRLRRSRIPRVRICTVFHRIGLITQWIWRPVIILRSNGHLVSAESRVRPRPRASGHLGLYSGPEGLGAGGCQRGIEKMMDRGRGQEIKRCIQSETRNRFRPAFQASRLMRTGATSRRPMFYHDLANLARPPSGTSL